MIDIEIKRDDYDLVILRMARQIGTLEVENAALRRTLDEMVEDVPLESVENLATEG